MAEQCAGTANRRRVRGAGPRPCAQLGTFYVNGRYWCWYHRPDKPAKFGEGYRRRAEAEKDNGC